MPNWQFYGRRAERAQLAQILDAGRWFFCSIHGRRRIGKTSLIRETLMHRAGSSGIAHVIYAQIPDSDERDVVGVFRQSLQSSSVANANELCVDLKTFADMARVIGLLCRQGCIVVLDEFQYFNRKALHSFASLLQDQVDRLTNTAHGGLFVLGSVQAEMTALLEGISSPLHQRLTHKIDLSHWDFETLLDMFQAQGVKEPTEWLTLWTLFEGVPKFYQDCHTQGVFDLPSGPAFANELIRRLFIEGASPLAEEADTWFLRELRGRYVSILRVLADKQPCSYNDMVQVYEESEGQTLQLSTYLDHLVERYHLVEKQLPIFANAVNRVARYVIADNFLQGWLAVIEPAKSAAKFSQPTDAVDKVLPKLWNHEGFAFERLIRQLHEEVARKGRADFRLTDQVRGYWNRPKDAAKVIEIDVVAWDDTRETVRFGSCKRNQEKHNSVSLKKFREHVDTFVHTKLGKKFLTWNKEFALFSPTFDVETRMRLTDNGFVCRDLRDYAALLTER